MSFTLKIAVKLALCGLLSLSSNVMAEQDQSLRVGVLKFGTVNWELAAMRTHESAVMSTVKVLPLATKNASHVALLGGAADIIVSDWVWVSRLRAEGKKVTFVPYANIVGSLLASPESGITSLTDLPGKKLGVAGGPVDKNWLLLQGLYKRQTKTTLSDLVSPSYAAPPLLNQLMKKRDLSAVLTFWHYGERLKVAGMKQVISSAQILAGLGVEKPVPMLGWVFHDDWAKHHHQALLAFLSASYRTKTVLKSSDSAWHGLRPLMRADDDKVFYALRDGYRTGIPTRFSSLDKQAVERILAILHTEGGNELTGGHARLSPGTFWKDFQIPE